MIEQDFDNMFIFILHRSSAFGDKPTDPDRTLLADQSLRLVKPPLRTIVDWRVL